MSLGNSILRRRSILLLQKHEGLIRGVIVELYALNDERESFISSVRKIDNAENHYNLRIYDITGDGNLVVISETRLSIEINDLFDERLRSHVLFRVVPFRPCPRYVWDKEGDDKGKMFFYGTLDSRKKDDSHTGNIWGTSLTKAKMPTKIPEKSSPLKETNSVKLKSDKGKNKKGKTKIKPQVKDENTLTRVIDDKNGKKKEITDVVKIKSKDNDEVEKQRKEKKEKKRRKTR